MKKLLTATEVKEYRILFNNGTISREQVKALVEHAEWTATIGFAAPAKMFKADDIVTIRTENLTASSVHSTWDEIESRDDEVIRRTLRDEFAQTALTGIFKHSGGIYGTKRDVAKAAYQYADEMMRARKVNPNFGEPKTERPKVAEPLAPPSVGSRWYWDRVPCASKKEEIKIDSVESNGAVRFTHFSGNLFMEPEEWSQAVRAGRMTPIDTDGPASTTPPAIGLPEVGSRWLHSSKGSAFEKSHPEGMVCTIEKATTDYIEGSFNAPGIIYAGDLSSWANGIREGRITPMANIVTT